MRQSLQKLNTRILALAMAVMLMLCAVPAVSAAQDSGSCGNHPSGTSACDDSSVVEFEGNNYHVGVSVVALFLHFCIFSRRINYSSVFDSKLKIVHQELDSLHD